MANIQERTEMACPLNGKMCIDGQREDFPKNKAGAPATCRWWSHLYGTHPQTGEVIDKFDCAVPWIPVTTIETAQKTNQVSAEVNEVRKAVQKTGYFTKKLATLVMRGAQSFQEALDKRAETKSIEDKTGVQP